MTTFSLERGGVGNYSATPYLSVDLNEQATSGVGYQATVIGGLGLPRVDARFVPTADGAVYSGRQLVPAEIDLLIDIKATSRADLKTRLRNLLLVLTPYRSDSYGRMISTLKMVDDDASVWTTRVVHVSGGDYSLGNGQMSDTEAQLTVTLRAPDPTWRRAVTEGFLIGGTGNPAFGVNNFVNTGDLASYPFWAVTGPGNNFKVTYPDFGGTLWWTGTLLATEALWIFTGGYGFDGAIVAPSVQKIVSSVGTNSYGLLAVGPRFKPIEAGSSAITVAFSGTTSASSVAVSWTPLRSMVM